MSKRVINKAMTLALTGAMAISLAACGGTTSSTGDAASDGGSSDSTKTESSDSNASASGVLQYKDIELGTTGTDIKTSIKLLTNRTDMLEDDYAGTSYKQYIAEFNKMYPDIEVNVEGITDYAEDSLLRLQGGEDWGDIMMIPAVAREDLSTYFTPYGTKDDVSKEAKYINTWTYQGETYGIPCTANAQGIVYNKRVFKDAGIDALPTTPDEFIADLQKIKDNTDAIPLYTNYAAGWTLGAWDAYLTGANGSSSWTNDGLIHGKDPFADPGDGTGAYNVYKILYDAVSKGLTEDDYTTTDWEGSKGMINQGKIACMVLGSWAVPQMQGAGDNADDIGYMPFPITVDGKMYASSGPDYQFGINCQASEDNQNASMIFVKWMTEKSGYSYNEGGLPIATDDDNIPDLYSEFTDMNVTYLEDDPAPEGEEGLMDLLNQDSELAINAGGNDKVAAIIEAASTGSESFDDIMNDWNQKWADAQSTENVDVK